MNMQVKSVILYSKNGEYRRLDFRQGKLNILAGEPQTGKSAIIPIIDYCFGNANLEIRSGIVTNTVDFYAVLYQLSDRQVLIAKPAPQGKNQSAYYEEGEEISVPENSERFETMSVDNEIVIEKLSHLLGISTTAISAKNSATFLFQEKSFIDSKDKLFNPSISNEQIKRSLLYFLKIKQDSDLRNEQKLSQLNAELKKRKLELARLKSSNQEKISEGQKLIRQAKDVGLISSEHQDVDTIQWIKSLLEDATKWQDRDRSQLSKLVIPDDINISQLEHELKELREEKRSFDNRIEELAEIMRFSTRYIGSADEQINRLKSIELFDVQDDSRRQLKRCPLCSSELDNGMPKVSEIKSVLDKLEQDLTSVMEKEAVDLKNEIESLRHKREVVAQQIKEKNSTRLNYYKEQDSLPSISSQDAKKTEICGAIKFYLGSFKPDLNGYLQSEVERLEVEINLVKSKLETESNQNFDQEATFSWLSEPMKGWAEKLSLEDSGSSYNFNFGKLTVVANRKGELLEMSRMESRPDWLGCHLMALLALHKAFLERQSGVPNFIIFDQLPEENIESFLGLFSTICSELTPNLQIIAITHGRLDNSHCQSNLIEPYWIENERALVPYHWISK